MFAYVTKKLLMVVPTVLGVTLVVFLMIRLIPGDPVVVMLGEQGVDAARQADFRARFAQPICEPGRCGFPVNPYLLAFQGV